MSLFRYDGEDLLLHCYLQPRASKTEVIGEHGGAIKIRINAPPVDGEANAELIAFLAKQFGVNKSAVHIDSGAGGRRKTVRVQNPNKQPDWLSSRTNT
ncbi:MAG: YggU family protein [Gammaproteobacteria bacterium]|nr:YggU family protein [Gammaproteobacteria bacterium]MBQ0774927.1 YggU family protein [Gammaproteobacteria bacterium]